jgi:DNA-binding NarL/FixJ family response regulator
MDRPTILLADDHTMFMEGLKGLLQDEFELLGTAENGEVLLEAAGRLDPDVIISTFQCRF